MLEPFAGTWRGIHAATPLQLWLATFLLVLGMGMLTQLVLLPYLLPGLHSGHGLVSAGDSRSYHDMAVSMAERISKDGWSNWRLRPQDQAPSGIAAALYAFFGAHPVLILPLNAACHATSLVVLHSLIRLFVPSALATMAVLPFALFPSTLYWLSQPNKDSLYVTGCYLFLLGFTELARLESWRRGWTQLPALIAFISSGIILAWVVRPYGVRLLQATGGGMMLLLLIWNALGKRLYTTKLLAVLLATCLFVLAYRALPVLDRYLNEPESVPISLPLMEGTLNNSPADICPIRGWQTLLPRSLDTQVCEMIVSRQRYATLYSAAGSNIDMDRDIKSALDAAMYIPRALQIALLAPFPDKWLSSGKNIGGLTISIVYAAEIVVAYIALIGLLLALWIWRRQLELWFMLLFGLGMMLPLGMAVPNMGTLYRMRFGFYMILISLGLAAWLHIARVISATRHNEGSR